MTRDAFVEWQERFGRAGTDVLDRLRTALAHHGTISADDLQQIAQAVEWPVAAVAGAASFYADFRTPRSPRHVRVCQGTSCFVSARGRNTSRIETALDVSCGQSTNTTSLDGAYCLGYCYESPAVLDGTTPLTGPDVDDQLDYAVPEKRPAGPVPHRCWSRQPVTLAGLVGPEQAWQSWPSVVTTYSPSDVLREVAAAGLRGRGGAGYPVATKWEAASQGAAPRYVVANGDEGDPGSYCDRLLMEDDPHRVLEGLALAGFAISARHGFVLVRSEYPTAVERMCTAVNEARAAGHLGLGVHGSTVDFDVEVVEGAGSYVAGEETALLRALQGLRGSVRPRPPYPTSHGFAQHPTAVNNVETLAALPWVLRYGGDAHARLGTLQDPGTKLVCLSQRFRFPGVYEVEFGVPLRFLVEELGGGLRDDHTVQAVQVGGPLGGFLAPDELDIPLSASALSEAGVALGHASLVAIDETISASDLLTHVWTFAASESCGACAPCRIGTRRGLELAHHPEPSFADQQRVLNVMETGSLCAFGRSLPGSVRSLLRIYSTELGGGR